ncbi:MAG: hypothetical protein ACP5E5_10640 [Acidobacteriaceae bacterium]
MDITGDCRCRKQGIEPTQIVSVVAKIPQGDGVLQLISRTPDGVMKERLLLTADESSISIASAERPFSFEGKGADFQLACEAKRIDFAFLFDPMMAVHTSNVEPLPHQITAVYESMLPRLRRYREVTRVCFPEVIHQNCNHYCN